MENEDRTAIIKIDNIDDNDKHAYIIFLSGPLMGKVHLLEEGSVTLGRNPDTDLPIKDSAISRQHVTIDYSHGKATLKDLGSTNGTYVNGVRIGNVVELQDNDKIQISSNTIFKYAYQDDIDSIFHNELYKMAVVDALTGANNKRFFEERAQEEFSYHFRNKTPLSLMMFDIDHFKKVNDTYGHPAGDYVLSEISKLTKSVIRNEDIFARYGGEEFVVLLKNTALNGAHILAERLRASIESHFFYFEGTQIKVSVSIGLTTLVERNYQTWEEFLKITDQLLYQSKHNGRNRVTVG